MSMGDILRAVSLLKEAGISVTGIRRRFWISTALSFTADIVVPGAVIVFRREGPRAMRERAFKFMGLSYYEVENINDVGKIVDYLLEEDEWEGIIKPIPPPPYKERRLPNAEIIALEAAKLTSKVSTEDLSKEVITSALGEHNALHYMVDKLALNDFGLTLTSTGQNMIDFEAASKRLERWIGIEDELFKQPGGQTIRNLLTLTAPNFIKNVVFLGGPRIMPGIIKLSSIEEVERLMYSFSTSMAKVEIYLDQEETKRAICNFYKKLNGEKFSWLKGYCLFL